jgi:hypothetical protein
MSENNTHSRSDDRAKRVRENNKAYRKRMAQGGFLKREFYLRPPEIELLESIADHLAEPGRKVTLSEAAAHAVRLAALRIRRMNGD